MTDRRSAGRVLLAALCAAAIPCCATAPKPSASSRRIAAKERGIIEGRVTDREGRAVAGIGVRGIPRGEDIPWVAPVRTDRDGRFRLVLPAPAAYGFLLSWNTTAVITPAPDDPSLVAVALEPGGRAEDVALVFDEAAWRLATAAAPDEALDGR